MTTSTKDLTLSSCASRLRRNSSIDDSRTRRRHSHRISAPPGIQGHLNRPQAWSKNNGCETSIAKCVYQIFGPRQKACPSFHLGGRIIKQVKKAQPYYRPDLMQARCKNSFLRGIWESPRDFSIAAHSFVIHLPQFICRLVPNDAAPFGLVFRKGPVNLHNL